MVYNIERITFSSVESILPGDLVEYGGGDIFSWPPDGLAKMTEKGFADYRVIKKYLGLVVKVTKKYVEHSGYRSIDLVFLFGEELWWIRRNNVNKVGRLRADTW